jgi:hypothetical protein
MRSTEGTKEKLFRFSHLSFQHYFLAERLARHLREYSIDAEVRARIKHVKEGTSVWEVEYRRVLEEIKRRKGLYQLDDKVPVAPRDLRSLTHAPLHQSLVEFIVKILDTVANGGWEQILSLLRSPERARRIGAAAVKRDPSIAVRNLVVLACRAGAALRKLDLAGLDLVGAVLRGADLSETTLQESKLTRCDLSDAILNDSDLQGAVLYGADLSGTQLRRVNLKRCRLGSNRIHRLPVLAGAKNLRYLALPEGSAREETLSWLRAAVEAGDDSEWKLAALAEVDELSV